MPWRSIIANMIFLKNHTAGRHVGSLFSHYTEKHFKSDAETWWVDQSIQFSISAFREELDARVDFFYHPKAIDFLILSRSKATGIKDKAQYLAYCLKQHDASI